MMMLTTLGTNRDLYLFVLQLARQHADTDRGLEHYLTALWQLGARERRANAISLNCFATLLEEAFLAPVPGQPLLPCARKERLGEGFQQWERMIASQIIDLREMRGAGTLGNEYRYLGVDAPSGARWYNFDPQTFLECAVAGSFGGWQEGDDTGRRYVPGKVVVFDSDGKLTAVDPQEIDQPVFELTAVSWEEFSEFLWAGQSYE